MALASGDTICAFTADNARPPTSNGMTFAVFNGDWARVVTAAQAAASTDIVDVYEGYLDSAYAGEAVDVEITHNNSTNTNNVLFSAELERRNSGVALGSDHFATLTDGSATAVPGTAGDSAIYSIPSVALPSGLTGKELCRLRITRRLSQAGDTNAGITRIFGVRLLKH